MVFEKEIGWEETIRKEIHIKFIDIMDKHINSGGPELNYEEFIDYIINKTKNKIKEQILEL